ncbi:Uncharacterised protein [Mycobacteroides abscessus subsp. abscessus]|nr:Uncharacterised protein [Mycobacteroides abscessus subsp. abscessus]
MHPYYFSSYTTGSVPGLESGAVAKAGSVSSRRSNGMTVATIAMPMAPTTTAPA